MQLGQQGFSEEEVSICVNNTAGVENLIVWHKELPNYREIDAVYIEFKTGPPHMVCKGRSCATGVQGGVNNGVGNVL